MATHVAQQVISAIAPGFRRYGLKVINIEGLRMQPAGMESHWQKVKENAVALAGERLDNQRMGEDVRDDLRRHMPLIGHIHLAQVPKRSGPTDAALFRDVRAIAADGGYVGWLGMEFIPGLDSIAELRAARELLLY